MIKPLWSNILLSQQNEKQVASTTGSVRLCSAFLNHSFLKETFHSNFTLKHNSLPSITGYTFSIPCSLPALPVTIMLPGRAAPAFRGNGHTKRKWTQTAEFHISRHTSQTALLWHKPKLKLPTARSSVIPSLHLRSPQQCGGMIRISALWLVLTSCKQVVLRPPFLIKQHTQQTHFRFSELFI